MKNPFTLFRKTKVDVSTIPTFELERYLGRWHEIARFDHWFERGLINATAEYSLQENGILKVVNEGFDTRKGKLRQAIGRAKATSIPGLLRVAFFWKFYADYRILSLGPNYDWALVASGSSGNYLWILSRTEALPEDTLTHILSEAEKRGFNAERLIYPKG